MAKESKDFGCRKNRNNTVTVKKGIPVTSVSTRYCHNNGKNTEKSFRQRMNMPSLR